LGTAAALALLLAACAAPSATAPGTPPGAAPRSAASAGPPATQPAAPPGWDQVVAAARAEGRLTVLTRPTTDWRKVFDAFQRDNPGIVVEHTGARPSDLVPRIQAEQQGGQYLWDAYHGPTNNVISILAPAGGLEDVRPFLVLPEVTAESAWAGGFEKWGHDLTHQPLLFSYGMSSVQELYAVNRDLVPPTELTSINDLADPKWKGKLVIGDPRVPQQGSIFLTCGMEYKNRRGEDGEGWLRRILSEQDPVIATDVRQITEWIVRGRYPVAIGAERYLVKDMRREGIAFNVEMHHGESACHGLLGGTDGLLAILKNPPHPNAAKLWVNWFLGPRGQQAFVDAFAELEYLSRRADVQQHYPELWQSMVAYGDGFTTGIESGIEKLQFVLRTSRELLR
jgi:iron(III) transport system substrate-binding protein